MSRCPTPDRFELLLAERLDDRERVTVEAHLQQCAACQETLEGLVTADAGHLRPRQAPDPVPLRFLDAFKRGSPVTPPARPPGNDRAHAGPGTAAVPGYEILGELGRGGMGVVYKARQSALGRVVALKRVADAAFATPEALARFRREAEALARLQHPHIVQVHDFGEHDGHPFFAMEFVDGPDLAGRLAAGPLEPRPAAALVETVARAVHAAHGQGIVHRDLKPANILLTADGTPKVTDFGLAKRLDEKVSQSGLPVGTPSYMAPEQVVGQSAEVGPCSDVYALGAVLYECLTGRPPFKAASVHDTLLQVIGQDVVPPRQLNRQVPRDLETVCLKCLHKERHGRYATAEELADDLARFRRGEPVRARPVGPLGRGLRWARRRPALAALTAALVLVASLGASLAAWQWRDAITQWHRAEGEAARASARAEEERKARERADAESEKARQNLYLQQVALAQREWEAGHVGRMIDLLDACPPDRRGWEWRYLRRLSTGTPLDLPGHTAKVHSVAFSPDGTRVASAGLDEMVKVWDVRAGRETLTLRGHATRTNSVAFSPDGNRIASAGYDQAVRVWDARIGAEVLALRGHTGEVTAVAFSSDGSRLVSSSHDKTVRVWDARAVRETLTLREPNWVEAVAFSPDGTRLAAATDQAVKVWDARTGRQAFTLQGHPNGVTGVAFSPDGSRIARWDPLESTCRHASLSIL